MARSTSSRFRAASIAAALLCSACSKPDPRLAKLSAGIARDSALLIMGAPAHRIDRYLINSQNLEAMYFTQPGAGTDSAGTTDRMMTPVILVNGTLAGWGWKQWDSIAAANKVQVAPEIK